MFSLPAKSAPDMGRIFLKRQILDELDYGRSEDCPQIIRINVTIGAKLYPTRYEAMQKQGHLWEVRPQTILEGSSSLALV